MKFNITPEDCKFFVDETARKVACVYEHSKQLFVNFACDNFDMANELFLSKNKLYKKCLMPDRFIGVAMCGKDDEWDEQIGRLIAFSRMKDNLNRSFFKRANTYFNWIDAQLNQDADLVNKVGEKLSRNEEHRHAYIEKLIGENPDGVSQN